MYDTFLMWISYINSNIWISVIELASSSHGFTFWRSGASQNCGCPFVGSVWLRKNSGFSDVLHSAKVSNQWIQWIQWQVFNLFGAQSLFMLHIHYWLNLVGGLEHVLWLSIQLGMSSSQLTFTPSFFRGVGLNHQPVYLIVKYIIYVCYMTMTGYYLPL